jgi:aldose 1-epimerase
MTFQVRTEVRPAQDRDGTLYILEDTTLGCGAEVWPALGGNCFRWYVEPAAALTGPSGRRVELLYADPQLFAGGKPTRSGIPVLFPFPNRVRAGRFTWDGRTYELPKNDPTAANAIHGFACRTAWRATAHGADATAAWVTMEFHLAQDAPEARPLWPADCRIRLTVRLQADRLRLEAVVDNPDTVPLPWGLGYHPYFQLPHGAAGALVRCPARSFWELDASLPTGAVKPVDAARDLRAPRRYGDLQLDDVLTGLEAGHARADGMRELGQVQGLTLWASPAFREVVAFTPPHRQAVCLEPYTCTTDAVNLQQRGVDAGWLTLAPGATWAGVVEMVLAAV